MQVKDNGNMSQKNHNITNNEQNECKPMYEWKIPSISGHNKMLLCYGYIRLNTQNSKSTPYIIEDIIKLFILYYCSDDYTFNDILNASYLQSFYSAIISIYSFKWYLQIYPNGCNENTRNKSVIFLKIANVPKQYKQISGQCKLSCNNNVEICRNFIFNEKNL